MGKRTLELPELRIRSIRKERRISQESLAAIAGLSRSQLSEIETSRTPVNTVRLRSIARALEVEPADLFASSEEGADLSRLRCLFLRLDPLQRTTVLAMLEGLVQQEREPFEAGVDGTLGQQKP
ncbi:helix-turn-helix domain-containing protein [Roseitranquillus sediminis]|uniref:helix-turn-helix domain-containing protein n=1 Tax=Roseitranquillus sediminis TaxID=2809051 RepID=UPI001D0C068D